MSKFKIEEPCYFWDAKQANYQIAGRLDLIHKELRTIRFFIFGAFYGGVGGYLLYHFW